MTDQPQVTMSTESLVTVAEIAAAYNISPQAVNYWIKKGYIVPVNGDKPRRFRLGDVMDHVAGRLLFTDPSKEGATR